MQPNPATPSLPRRLLVALLLLPLWLLAGEDARVATALDSHSLLPLLDEPRHA